MKRSGRYKRARVSCEMILRFMAGRCDLNGVESIGDQIPDDAEIVHLKPIWPNAVEYVIRSKSFDRIEFEGISEIPELDIRFRRPAPLAPSSAFILHAAQAADDAQYAASKATT